MHRMIYSCMAKFGSVPKCHTLMPYVIYITILHNIYTTQECVCVCAANCIGIYIYVYVCEFVFMIRFDIL